MTAHLYGLQVFHLVEIWCNEVSNTSGYSFQLID